MADLTQTPANVETASGAAISTVQAGEAFDAGTPVYQLASDGKYYKADANDALKYVAVGIAISGASSDGYFVLQRGGDINIGATTVKGEIYILSNTAGAIAPHGDLATGWYPVILCIATDTAGNCIMGISVGTATRS